ncbi:MAG TPA: TaqI-like C-terminal specificity domain-containing protein, partial [Pedobacter sp.]|nr:TaqI-like C-terminal specificity domain-containing protein [Pedobacter sp.]
LRGRDIKRYEIQYAELYIIATFPSMRIDIDKYPAVKGHLMGFGYDRLKQTGDLGARKKTNNKWFETQDSIGYWDDFNRQKIIWIELTDHPNFSIDSSGYFLNNTVFFISGKQLKYLTAFLNSKICEWYFDKICATSGVGTRRWIKMYIDQIAVPKIKREKEQIFDDLIDSIMTAKRNGENTTNIDEIIEKQISELFNFSDVEFDYIKSSTL